MGSRNHLLDFVLSEPIIPPTVEPASPSDPVNEPSQISAFEQLSLSVRGVVPTIGTNPMLGLRSSNSADQGVKDRTLRLRLGRMRWLRAESHGREKN